MLKNKKLWIIGIICLLITSFVIGGIVVTTSDTVKQKKIEKQLEAERNEKFISTVEEMLSQAKEKKNKVGHGIGESVDVGDYTIKLVEVQEEFRGVNDNEPQSILLCKFEIKNRSAKNINVIDHEMITATLDGQEIEMLTFDELGLSDSNKLEGIVETDKELTGIVGYLVDEGWSGIEIRVKLNENIEEVVFSIKNNNRSSEN